jgi:hypothetical protein
MTECLRNLFTRVIRGQQNGDTNKTLNYSGDIVYFCIPKDKTEKFYDNGPQKWKLNISSFMWLYKHATDDLLDKPGHGYMYEKFVLVVDGEYMRVEGWVSIPKLDLSWCRTDEDEVNGDALQQHKPSKENVVSVDISKNVSRTEKLIGIKEENIYTSKALLLSKSQRDRIRFWSYSRHMNQF